MQISNPRANRGLEKSGIEKPQWVSVRLSRCITVKNAMTMFAANTHDMKVNRFFDHWMKRRTFSVSAGFHWYSIEDKAGRPDRCDRLHFTIEFMDMGGHTQKKKMTFHVYVALESLRGHWQWRDVKITGVSGPGFHSRKSRNGGRF